MFEVTNSGPPGSGCLEWRSGCGSGLQGAVWGLQGAARGLQGVVRGPRGAVRGLRVRFGVSKGVNVVWWRECRLVAWPCLRVDGELADVSTLQCFVSLFVTVVSVVSSY